MSAFIVLLLETSDSFCVLSLELRNDIITLPEFFFDYLEFSGISKCVFALHYFFQLSTESDAFFAVHFDFDFEFALPSGSNIAFQTFNFISSKAHFGLEILYLPLQIDL